MTRSRSTKSPELKPQFIRELQHALINVGFLYLSNVPVETAPLEAYIPQLFALPRKPKTRSAWAEFTKGRTDWREQFDIATPHVCRGVEGRGDPDYWTLWGPSQWPDEDLLPGFKATMERYLWTLKRFYDRDELMQHRGKIGVGPHYDAGFLTFLLQASDHKGLQVQNLSGDWIDVPPSPAHSLSTSAAVPLEFATQGLARATSHRVLSPSGGTGPRYSVPFFQNIGLDVKLTDTFLSLFNVLLSSNIVPPEILALRDARGNVGATDSVNFTEFDREPSGRVNLIGRVKSHPDVAARHYPALFKEVFPNGVPAQASAY
ncbi:hypothetical protein B0H12DRAFT_1261375 [Mycena haematopus]|nr:hypothetical protein B0H12DRAFT_1261375 [Mycena haematopus]